MTDPDSLRGDVAAQLVGLSAAGRPLNTDAAMCTAKRYAGDASRFAVRKDLISRYLKRQNPRRDGRSAIITAGAPGAGKTRVLHAQVYELDDYRILDADIVKDYLIEQALEDGIYDDLLAIRSPTDIRWRHVIGVARSPGIGRADRQDPQDLRRQTREHRRRRDLDLERPGPERFR